MKDDLVKIANGEVYFWTEHGTSIHIKAITSFGDPVELSMLEAEELAEKLTTMISKINE